MNDDDRRHMSHALGLARRGLGQVWPNPSVGCVIVKEGRIVGRGRTGDGGRPHGETQALKMAGDAARGATAYVTLEPCAHTGQTPPCSEALIAAGIARVVVALKDPDARVCGKGLAALSAAGIEVATGVLEDQARALQEGFLRRVTDGRPKVTLKLAVTLDGRIATATGDSQWITGPDARRIVHGLRHAHDAVLVGAGTARADNPTLTVRDMGAKRQPVRIVASRSLDLPYPNRLTETIDQGPVWLAHGAGEDVDPKVWRDAGARLLPVPVKDGRIDPVGLMHCLGAEGLTRVFCEGGGAFAASLLAADLVDELVVFSAGRIFGSDGLPAIGTLGVKMLDEAPRLRLHKVRQVGDDILHVWNRAF